MDGFTPDIQLLFPNKLSLEGKEVHHVALELDSDLMVVEVGQKLSTVVMPLPMPFTFYGTIYTDLIVGEDGYVSFAHAGQHGPAHAP